MLEFPDSHYSGTQDLSTRETIMLGDYCIFSFIVSRYITTIPIPHLRKAGQLRAELDHLILDQGLHAGLPEAEVPQVLEEKPPLLPPVPSASRDDPRHLTLVLRAQVLPAGSGLVQWRVGHPGRSLISLQNFYNKQWP